MKKIKSIFPVACIVAILLFVSVSIIGQQNNTAKIAVIQASGLARQDPFMDTYNSAEVRPQMMAHFSKLLGLFEEAGKILFNSLAVPIPGPLTDKLSSVAKEYKMYIIAPIYESVGEKIYNTAVIFDREGNIIGKHRKTVLPVMETWLVSTGVEYEVYHTDFATIAIAICWEISYPEISTIYALKGADIIFNPTMAPDNKRGESLSTAPMFITRAKDNGVYIAPVVLGTDGNGILDFNGNVVAESVGKKDEVIMAEIDFSKDRTSNSKWWETINGTNNTKALHYKSRRPETYKLLIDPNPPILEKYKDIHLTTGDREKQLEAVRKVDYGPHANNKK